MNNCNLSFPSWVCFIGTTSGYISSVIWLVVLLPQLLLNWKRKSVVGLSLVWAIFNLTASIFNLFFVFRLEFPLFFYFSAVYMPVLETAMILQFILYTPRPFPKITTLTLTMAAFLWTGAVIAEIFFPVTTKWLEWVSVVLWSIELLPQLMLNQYKGSTHGQSTLALSLTFLGKTTDALSVYLLTMPLQQVILAYFSSTQAYVNIIQFLWYNYSRSHSRCIVVCIAFVGSLICALAVALIHQTHEAFWAWLCPVLVFAVCVYLCCIRPIKVFTPEAVRKIAQQILNQVQIPEDLPFFALAGGCFKSLVTAKKPRDLDLFAFSEDDKNQIVSALKLNSHELQETAWNYQFEVPLYAEVSNHSNQQRLLRAPAQNIIRVEVVKNTNPGNLEGILARFDICLAAIGVTVCGNTIEDIIIHPDAEISLQVCQPLLILPMPNEPFLLATAERVIRYADELGFPKPTHQLNFLRKRFLEKMHADQQNYLQNYENTSLSSSTLCKVLDDHFDIISPPPDMSFNPSQQRFYFNRGQPNIKCRVFTSQEKTNMIDSVLTDTLVKQATPIAVFVSGLPCSGKSTSLSYFFKLRQWELKDFAIIDADNLRQFHQQYLQLSGIEVNDINPSGIVSCARLSYTNLVEWFMNGTHYETEVYRNPEGLVPVLLKRKLSFVHTAIMDTQGCLDFIDHVRNQGYVCHFIHIHVPIKTAVIRAVTRGHRTGRWSSNEFIRSRVQGIKEQLPRICARILSDSANGSSVTLFDNTAEKICLAPENVIPRQHCIMACSVCPVKMFDSNLHDSRNSLNYVLQTLRLG